MMEIKDFESLVSFIINTYQKTSLTFGVKNPSGNFISYVEDTLQKYIVLYNKPLYFLEKQKVKLLIVEAKEKYVLDKAIATMPHGKLWRFFHPALWQKIKQIENKEEQLNPDQLKEKEEVLIPDIVHNRFPEPIDSDEVEIN